MFPNLTATNTAQPRNWPISSSIGSEC